MPVRARGQEHVVRVLPQGWRVVKTGVPGREGYGLTPYLKRSREIGLRPGTPAEYFERLRLQNALLGDDLGWEGVTRPRAGGKVEIVISQGFVTGDRPTATEIARWFSGLGFLPVAGQEAKTFYRPADNVAVFDAHEGNLIATPEGLVPIDVVILHPDDLLLSALEQALG